MLRAGLIDGKAGLAVRSVRRVGKPVSTSTTVMIVEPCVGAGLRRHDGSNGRAFSKKE
jgi:hypothetical protein